jgi:manganese/zinc/iron transport system permease protein
MNDLLRILTLRAGYNAAVVLLGVTLLGAAAGVVGSFTLLRKRALIGDALAHATLPGIALAFLLSLALGGPGRSLAVLLPGAAASGILAVACVHLILRHGRLREDAAIGIVLSVFFGAGVVLLSHVQSLPAGTQGGLNHFIFGQTAAMSAGDVALIAAVAGAAVLAALALLKEFRAVCFDERFARSLGYPVWLIDALMMALVVTVTVVGLQAVGLLLIIALLIIPAAAARFWTDRMTVMLGLAGLFGAASGYAGAAVSAMTERAPAGGVIVLAAGAVFAISLLAAPRRGVAAAAVGLARLRLNVAYEHTLRAIYESLETRAADAPDAASIPLDLDALRRRHGWSRARLALFTALLRRRGLVARDPARGPSQVSLTPAGLDAAARITRGHRLWEQYLIAHADLPPSHVDRSADMVEHVLSPDLVARLEQAVEPERPSTPTQPPPSPHPLS